MAKLLGEETMSADRPTKVSFAVEELFRDGSLRRDLALHLLTAWNSNLEATERAVDRALLAIVALFAGFLALDRGILVHLTIQGTELGKTGPVLCVVPVSVAYLYYRNSTRISFAHDLRTAVAVLYKMIWQPVYFGGLDLLTHVPSVRNLEAYDSFFAPRRMRAFHEGTTSAVTAVLVLGPPAMVVYSLVRLWSYRDVGPTALTITVLLSTLFVVRALLYGLRSESEDAFATRRREPGPLLQTNGEDSGAEGLQQR